MAPKLDIASTNMEAPGWYCRTRSATCQYNIRNNSTRINSVIRPKKDSLYSRYATKWVKVKTSKFKVKLRMSTKLVYGCLSVTSICLAVLPYIISIRLASYIYCHSYSYQLIVFTLNIDIRYWFFYLQNLKKIGIQGRIRSGRFLCIFTEAFLLFLAPAGSSNPAEPFFSPAWHSLTLN